MKKGRKIVLYTAICVVSFVAGTIGVKLTRHPCVSEETVATSEMTEDKKDKIEAYQDDSENDAQTQNTESGAAEDVKPEAENNTGNEVQTQPDETFAAETAQDDNAAKATVQNENVSGLININTADAATLMTLYGVGEKISQRIIEYRETNGPFEVIEDIMKVSGIGEKRFENIKDKICVN